MSICGFECLKQFVCSFLYDDFYTLDCYKIFLRIFSVLCLGIFLIKFLSEAYTKNMFAFSFGLYFMFGTYVCHCILSYFCGKEENNS